MKPIRLIMSAFGPYKDRVEVDFSKIGADGIFLITGDTGSGKTTIFDAISFALFGSASGSRRENATFRSDFAKDTIKTYVELEFLHKGVIYKIERVPRYTRKKLRGDGTTVVGGDATLTYFDKVVTGDKNITEKCEEILGVNALQFKQIVMIAQGEFLELLLAKPKERANIFRRIFSTEIFRDISDELKGRYLNKKREYEDIKLSFNHYLGEIIWGESFGDELMDIENILALLESLNEEDFVKQKQLKKDSIRCNKRIQEIIKQISEVKLVQESRQSLQENQQILEKLLLKQTLIDEKRELVFKNEEILKKVIPLLEDVKRLEEELNKKKKVLDDRKGEYDFLVSDSSLIVLDYEKLEYFKNRIEELKDKSEECEKKLGILAEIEELRKKVIEQEELLVQVQLMEKRQVLSIFSDWKDLMEEIEQDKIFLVKLEDEYRKKNLEYMNSYQIFLNEQAAILAVDLKDNCPCPVCGSLNHPKLATLSSNVLSRDELDSQKQEVECLHQELEKKVQFIQQKNLDLQLLETKLCDIDEGKLVSEVLELEKKCQGSMIDEENIKKIQILDLEKELGNLKVLLDNKMEFLDVNDTFSKVNECFILYRDEIKKLEKKVTQIQEMYEAYILKRESLESVIALLKEEVIEGEERLCKKQLEYMQAYSDLGYENEEDYCVLLLNSDVFEKYRSEVFEYDDTLNKVSLKIDTLRDFVRGKKEINLNLLEEEKSSLEDTLTNMEVSLKDINHKLSNNVSIYNKLKNVYQKMIKLEKEVMIYKDLSDTANGTIKGKTKLEFEQFVQASYFDMVLKSANERFLYMTDERYQLLRKEKALKVSDQLGLELEIMDYYTGKRRDIRSLSGGESFKAALALALGMSDTIQSYSGGIVVDAMFIDEGFGSLDNSSLESAMDAIMMLSQKDRMIGIISHVEELKERIDKKIVVTKSNCGSCVRIIV